MIEVAPQNAQLGDLVDLDWGRVGAIVGISNDNDCAMVLWSDVPGADVIGFNSPLWRGSTIWRATSELCEDESIGFCTACCSGVKRDGSCQCPAPVEPETDVPGFKLPWGDANGA